VLAQDEKLLEIFVQASPMFERLRNPAMRRTMARLVSVEQAARVAGIDVSALLAMLNGALAGEAPSGHAPAIRPASPQPVSLPDFLGQIAPERLVDLDVREDLRAGREPFRRIMEAVQALTRENVLRLRAIFEPVPLYAVLEKRGFAHFTEWLGAEDFRVWFYPAPKPVLAQSARSEVAPSAAPAEDVIVLDVRGLEPPEPMVRTLEALATMPRGQTLVQLNVRVPEFLLPKLAERGFSYEVREQTPDLVRLFIRHKHP
jgi:uncharacterized protein (DUF2249 family)